MSTHVYCSRYNWIALQSVSQSYLLRGGGCSLLQTVMLLLLLLPMIMRLLLLQRRRTVQLADIEQEKEGHQTSILGKVTPSGPPARGTRHIATDDATTQQKASKRLVPTYAHSGVQI